MVNMDRPAPSLLTRSARSTEEEALKAAFATDDMRRICGVIDAAVLGNGISKVAQESEVRPNNHLSRISPRKRTGAGYDDQSFASSGIASDRGGQSETHYGACAAKVTTRLLTMAFRGRNLHLAIAFAKVLCSQENVSELARNTIIPRENLYRAFAFPRIPRFRTVLNFLNAIGLRIGIERLPSSTRATSRSSTGVPPRGRPDESRRHDRKPRTPRVPAKSRLRPGYQAAVRSPA